MTISKTVSVASAIGRNIRRLRVARGVSQRELARNAGLSCEAYVGMIERGLVREPGPSILSRLAAALQVPVEDLMQDVLEEALEAAG